MATWNGPRSAAAALLMLLLCLVPAADASAATSVTWTRMTPTSVWPGYNGWLTPRYDPVSGRILHYGIPQGSGSIYSTDLFFYDVPSNSFIYKPIYSSLTGACTASTSTLPGDRHPYAQMAIDTRRNLMWMYGGACQPCGGAMVDAAGTAVTWVGGNVFNPSWVGQQLTIAGADYTVAAVVDGTHLTLTASAGVQDNVFLSLARSPQGYTYTLHLNADPAQDTWQRMPAPTTPDASIASAMVYDPDDDVLFVFGSDGASQTHNHWVYGATDLNPVPGVLTAKQIAAGCTTGDDWCLIAPVGGIRPQGVGQAGLVYDPDIRKVVQLGGNWGDNSTRNETWVYDIPSRTWTQKGLSTIAPPVAQTSANADSQMIYDPNTRTIIRHQAAGPGAPADWEYDPVADTWTLLTSIGGGPTPVVSATQIAFDPVHNVLFTWSYNGPVGDVWQGSLGVATPSAPAITQQASSQTVAAGSSASFTVLATGSPPPTYRWQSDPGSGWSDISGATSNSYTMANALISDSGTRFRCVAANGVGSPAISDPAILTVTTAALPTILGQPQDVAVHPGQTAAFTVSATGGTLSYQWRVERAGASGFDPIIGATGDAYTTPILSTTNDGDQVEVIVTNSAGSVTSAIATVRVFDSGSTGTSGHHDSSSGHPSRCGTGFGFAALALACFAVAIDRRAGRGERTGR